MESYFRSYVETLKMELDRIDYYALDQIINVILNAREDDKQIFIIGNGGSAATASHLACDLAKGTIIRDDLHFRRFRTVSLTDNMAIFTAVSNDIGYEHAFVEQLKNFLNPGDVVIAITASGNSPNILTALQYARKINAVTVGLLGFGGGRAREMVDYQLTIQTRNYGIAEDFHLIAGHILSQLIRRLLQKDTRKVLFLDRDGVINLKADEHDYVKKWNEFYFHPEVFEGLRILQQMNYRFIITSNQRGIARGLFSLAELEKIHTNMLQILKKEAIEIDKIYFCPHDYSDNCGCRKPALGMFYRAQSELPYVIDLSQSFVIGDSETDIEAGKNLGVKTVFVKNGSNKPIKSTPTFVVDTLFDFANILREESFVPGLVIKR